MWMLTKFAMIFFILALSVILVAYSANEKAALCSHRAAYTAIGIQNAFVNVLNSPVEDERKIIPLERMLSAGGDEFASYEIKLTKKTIGNGGEASHRILVQVLPTRRANCNGFANLEYARGDNPSDLKKLQDNDISFIAGSSASPDTLTVTPSETGVKQSTYLILIKCSGKKWPSRKYLFVQDCKQQQPNECYNFETVKKQCGWEETGGSGT